MDTLKAYYQLTKPGIIRGNAIHVLAGAFLASTVPVMIEAMLAVLTGTSLVIASACVANNYIDRGIDARMKRTKKRASVTGLIPLKNAVVFAGVLGVLGFTTLVFFTNWVVVAIGLIAYVFYVVLYAVAKRRTVHSTLIGAVPGALPAMAGYVAISGSLDVGAWAIFALVLIWQMPHFYAISVFRREEYAAAKIPVLAVVQPFAIVKRYILAYMIMYLIVITVMITTRVVAPVPGALLLFGAALWMYVFATTKGASDRWAKSIFGTSLVLTLLLLVTCGLNILTRV